MNRYSWRNEGAAQPAWYRHVLGDGSVCFTPYRKMKKTVKAIGPGDRAPTPAEIAQALSENPNIDLEANGSISVIRDEELTDQEPLELPAGSYRFVEEDAKMFARLEETELRSDSYVKLDTVYEQIATDIRRFLSSESVYRDLGFQFRRGVLLYGPPGNGKTSLIRELMKKEVPEDSILIFFDCLPPGSFLNSMKATLSQRLKICVFEELVAVVNRKNLDQILQFLDGERSLDRALIIATTNYPERLPGNIVDRPSRFDKIYEIKDPVPSEREMILSHYLGRKLEPAEVEATQGLSVAALREVCLLVRISEDTVLGAAKKLAKHRELMKRAFAEAKPIGIWGDDSGDDDD